MKQKRVFITILRYLILIAVFIGLFYLIQWFYSTRTTTTYTAPVPPVEVEYPQKRTIVSGIELSGYIEAKDTIPVVPYVEGTIVEYYVQEGDIVQEGDLVAQVDPEPYLLQLEQAEAAYFGYSSTFERTKTLYEKNAVSKQEYDTLKAQTDAAKAQVDLATLQLSYTDVVAHASGTVLKTTSAKGSTATKGVPVAVIADLDELVVNVKLGEQYFDLVSTQGDSLSITVSRPASAFSQAVTANAAISHVSPYIDPTSKNFSLQVKLQDELRSFRPGMYVKVNMVYDRREVYALPRKVMKLDGSAYYVVENVVEDVEEDKAMYLDLRKTLMNNEYFEVPDVYKDMAFIIKGQESVLSGQTVNVLATGVEK